MMARMDSPPFGVQATVAGGDLPEEWQALIASQASTLAALGSRRHTGVGYVRQRYAVPQEQTARWQALAVEAEQVLTAQAQGQDHVAHEGCNAPDPRRGRRGAAGAG